MTAYVIDTNVPVTANGLSAHAGPACVLACIDALENARTNAHIILDSTYHILQEYIVQVGLAGQPGAGHLFVKWVFDNQCVSEHCIQVDITPTGEDGRGYLEFPDDKDLEHFDRSDRKFVAVALSSNETPTILNATDTDWWENREALAKHDVRINFLCPNEMLHKKRNRKNI